MLRIISDEAGGQFIVKLLEDDWTTFRPKWKWLCQDFVIYPSPSRCSNAHSWWLKKNWFWSIRGIQVRPACRQNTKGPVPWRRRGCCSRLFSDIRKKITTSNWNNDTLQARRNLFAEAAEAIPEPSVTITDGMSLAQKMKGNDQTFSQHAYSALTHILHEWVTESLVSSLRIEKTRSRTQGYRTGILFKSWCHVTGSSNGERFLAARPTLNSSILFVMELGLGQQGSWWWNARHSRRETRSNYGTSETICLHISNDQLAEVAGLQSNSEEADTRIMLHAAHAATDGYRAFVVTWDVMGDSSWWIHHISKTDNLCFKFVLT